MGAPGTHMPKLKALSEDEFMNVKASRKTPKKMSQRERKHRRYCRHLEKFKKGAYVEVTFKPSEKRQTEKNRLMRAAEDLGLKLEFKRTRGKLRFQVK